MPHLPPSPFSFSLFIYIFKHIQNSFSTKERKKKMPLQLVGTNKVLAVIKLYNLPQKMHNCTRYLDKFKVRFIISFVSFFDNVYERLNPHGTSGKQKLDLRHEQQSAIKKMEKKDENNKRHKPQPHTISNPPYTARQLLQGHKTT